MVSTKANLFDMKKTIAEVAQNIENRASYEDVKRIVEDKVSKSELHFLL